MNKNMSLGGKEPTAPSALRHATISEDKRATEYLANERTFLAWVRTSIAIISLGFVVSKFSVWLRELAVHLDPQAHMGKTGASLPIGVTMMAFGGFLAVLAARRYWVVNRAIDCGKVRADHGLIITITAMIVLLALAMIFYMLLAAEKA